MTPAELIAILKAANGEELAEIRELLGVPALFGVPWAYPVPMPTPAPTPTPTPNPSWPYVAPPYPNGPVW